MQLVLRAFYTENGTFNILRNSISEFYFLYKIFLCIGFLGAKILAIHVQETSLKRLNDGYVPAIVRDPGSICPNLVVPQPTNVAPVPSD